MIVRFYNNWYYKIGEAAKITGVHPDTLRNWEAKGYLTPLRTPRGHRLYSTKMINAVVRKVPVKSLGEFLTLNK